jgi:TolA-binding protein
MSTSSSNQNVMAMLILAIIGLLGLNGYQWYTNSKLTDAKTIKETELVELQKVQTELNQDYETALASLEDMRGDNAELNKLIDNQKAELKTQKEKINNLIWTKRELDKAKVEINNLNANVTKYLADIQQLKEQNGLLTEENTKLTARVDEEVKAKEEVIAARNVLSTEKENLSKSNTELGSKVDMANAIKINYIDVKGYEVKKDGKLKERSKGKDINLMRTCFMTETNMVTPAGNKRFYIRLINPQGETISIEDAGSGVLTNKLDNTQVRYTTSGEVNYKNEDTNACVDWKLSEQLAKGNYKVEIYNNGFPVGKGQFVIK